MEIPSITRLSKSVVRVLGQNPGHFTLQGTNTYLVGQCNPYILLDTGEGRDEYIPLFEQAIRESIVHPDKLDVSDIIITHRHHDHYGGLPSVLASLRRLWDARITDSPFRPPRIHKIPLASPDTRMQSVIDSLPPTSFSPNASGAVMHDLLESQTIPITTDDTSAEPSYLQVLHTPGHTADSLCLYYPTDRALFTADTILGYGTSIFEDLASYMTSLRRLIAFSESGGNEKKYATIYPGHGPVVEDGPARVAMYLRNREDRETEIVKTLTAGPPASGPWTTWTLVSTIYARYPRELWVPAAHSADLHMKKLEMEGRVECLGGTGHDTQWEFIR